MKIVVLERNSVGLDVPVDGLSRFAEVEIYPNTQTEEEVSARIANADIVVCNKAPLNKRTLENATKVKLINEFATGYDNIDIDYCRDKGIRVTNVVNYSTDAVAQHTFALAFYLLEKLRHYDEFVKCGGYAAQTGFSVYDIPFTELSGKTWGVIGMGNIGTKVSGIASAFGCRVLHYSVSGWQMADGEKKNVEFHNGRMRMSFPVEEVDFETLLAESDFVSLHCPLSEKSRGLINYEALSKMKKTAILINVARGPIVVDEDLARALNEDLIGGAGLDVTGTEPMQNTNPLSKITDSNKLIITPHLAWASIEARHRVVSESIKNIEAFLNGEERNIVV